MTRVILTALLAFVSSGFASGQKASYTFFGKGCQFLVGVEFVPFKVQGVPALGKTLRITTRGWTPNIRVFILTGLSNTRFGSFRLPFDPRRLGGGRRVLWCGLLRTSVDSQIVASAVLDLPIPNDTKLLGLTFYQQVMEVWAQLPFFQVLFSRGGQGVIGR